ncbi:MAG: LuxR C-terminal-related transcriptional regulator, partial [Pseudomonadota bacterium]
MSHPEGIWPVYSPEFEKHFATILSSQTPEAALAAAQSYLESFDIWAFNYGYFDTRAQKLDVAPVQFVSTMDPSWIEHYTEHRYDMLDLGVENIRKGNVAPVLTGHGLRHHMRPLNEEEERFYQEAGEAGFHSSAIVPLKSPRNAPSPEAGIGLMSKSSGAAFERMWAERRSEILIFLMQLHQVMSPDLTRRLHDMALLSPREQDCLAYLSKGLRPDRIGDRLGLATVTVNFHIRSARQKLEARTNPEAIAKALA